MTEQYWVCAPCQAGDCRGCDIVDGRRALRGLPMRACACPRCSDQEDGADGKAAGHEAMG